jgi:transcriptional regulator of arginine metabolism
VDKRGRQLLVREIIGSKRIANQDELRLELKKRGCAVTQATLSRDLHELGVGRVSTPGAASYALPATPGTSTLRPIAASQVISIGANESLIVIRTHPACANIVAEFIDNLGSPEIIGTLAGDNTVLVIPRSARKTVHTLNILRNKLIEGSA